MNLNRMRGVVDMEVDQAVELLAELQHHAEAVGDEYRHTWRHGDIGE